MKYKILIFFLIMLFPLVLSKNKEIKKRDSDKLIISKVEAWKGKKSVEFKLLLKIGTDDFDKEEYIFGGITDIEVDQHGNIYVLDFKNYRIQKFAQDGKFLQSYGGIKGVGPGEFSEPRRFALDSQNNLYITDLSPPRIIILDSKGVFKKSITLRFYPGDIIVGKSGKLYITDVRSKSKYWVHRFNVFNGELEGSFCEKNNKDILIYTSYTGNLCSDKDGNIYYSFFYPYEIRKYSENGELLLSFSRKAPFFKPPFRDEMGIIRPESGTWDIISLPDGKIIHLIRDLNFKNKEFYSYLDFFDENGRWLLSIPSAEVDQDWKESVIANDYQGNIYLTFSEPFPHIRKYSMKFIEK
ncbi:MAG: NHL repeat-containing protein [Acidobacteriota bacterium]